MARPAACGLGVALALAAVALGCARAGAAAQAGGTVWVAGNGQLRALRLPDLGAAGELRLAGPLVASSYDARRHRLDLLVGGAAPALEAIAAGAPRLEAQRSLALQPAALALDSAGQRLYLAGTAPGGGGRVWALAAATLRVEARLAVAGQPRALALSADGRRLLLASDARPALRLIALAGWRPLARLALNQAPRQLVVLPYGHKAFVLCGDTVAVVDTDSGALLCYLPVGPGAQRLLLKPDGGELYVSNASGTVSAINTTTNEVSDTMAAGLGAASMAVAADGSTLYVGNAAAGTVSVINLDNRKAIAMVRVGEQPASLALSPGGRLLLVADAGSDDVAVVRSNQDPANPNTLLTLLPSPPAPQWVRALAAAPAGRP
ncbi:MAG TPA: YncE family protein [Terriglobales bacterium]|nr:YncE family protein [Terriglobales bacterium]